LVAISPAGVQLANALLARLPGASMHVLARYAGLAEQAEPFVSLGEIATTLFAAGRGLVLFAPVGVAVRTVASLLTDKRLDPPVVAVDDGGRFAISLVGSHAGGANELAERVAAALGAQPVVTTAVERSGLPAPELIGLPLGWRLQANREALLRCSAAIAQRRPIALYQPFGPRRWLPPEVPVVRASSLGRLAGLAESSRDAGLAITDERLPANVSERFVVWRPRLLAAGLGCSRGASTEELAALLERACAALGADPAGLRCLASLDRKLDEPGLVALAQRLEVPLRGYPPERLAQVPVPRPSEAVRHAVGTPSVAEASAMLSAPGGLLLPKLVSPNATVAIAGRLRGRRPWRADQRVEVDQRVDADRRVER
jgi:cobalamin biosynthesis protein CbiG